MSQLGQQIGVAGRQTARVGVGYILATIAVFVAEQVGFPQLAEIELELGAVFTLGAAWASARWGT